MHQGFPEGNTKLVLILARSWALPTIGPGLRLFQRVLPFSVDVHRTPSCGSAPTPHASRPNIVHLAYLNEVQRCICMNARMIQ